MEKRFAIFIFVLFLGRGLFAAAPAGDHPAPLFPRPVTSYTEAPDQTALGQIKHRASEEPLNVLFTLLFFCAIVHTFLAPKIMHLAHHLRDRHDKRRENSSDPRFPKVSFKAEILHFFGEIEAVFGIWVIPLILLLTFFKGWSTALGYIEGLHFTEPVFVVIIMTIAATRPVLTVAEWALSAIVRLFGSSPGAWWFIILTIGPLLGSFITEPAAMTISALLLRQKFFRFRIPPKLAYATVGLLFVNISIGGALTNFAAPPILMVARVWDWSTLYVMSHFGLKSASSIFLNTLIYYAVFRKHFKAISTIVDETDDDTLEQRGVPTWTIVVHLLFLVFTVFTAHHVAFIVFGFLIFLAFTEATEPHQDRIALRPALLVGFFLAGLVVHGGLQGWWIQPVLSTLSETPLMFGAIALTAFNDNAAITYLASQVPNLSESLKYAVVAGALIGGGLTVIANAPNPAGQALLQRYFPDGLSPLRLFLGAAFPTFLTAMIFWLLPH